MDKETHCKFQNGFNHPIFFKISPVSTWWKLKIDLDYILHWLLGYSNSSQEFWYFQETSCDEALH